MTEGELGKKVYLESGTLAPLLKRLEKRGLIERIRPESNERELFLKLTPDGEALKQKALAVPCPIRDCIRMPTQELLLLRELAGHTFQHELRISRINGMLGSIDANQGDMTLGWDTDCFPSNVYDTTLAMYEIVKNGGLPVGISFDSKNRRPGNTLLALERVMVTGRGVTVRAPDTVVTLVKPRGASWPAVLKIV